MPVTAALTISARSVQPDADAFRPPFRQLNAEGAHLFGQRQKWLEPDHVIRADGREVDGVADDAVRQIVADGGSRLQADELLGLGGRGRDVRRRDDLWQLREPPVGRRLFLEHVEPRAAHMPRLDRVGERGLVDQLATRRVDQPHAFPAFREARLAEQVPGLGRGRNVEADVVRRFAHAVERQELDAERSGDVLGNERIVRDNFHAERAGARGHFLPDPSEADEPKRLPAEFRAHQLFLVPHAALHRAIGGRNRSRRREHQREGVFGDAHAVAARRVHHEDAARARRREIDVVDAGARTGNHPKFRRLGDESFVNLRRAANDQRVGMFEIGTEYVRRAA
jgi:hypothetical protein